MDFSGADGLLRHKASAGTETGLILKLRPPPILTEGFSLEFPCA
eukprot:COSAG02_NODE_6061_length_3833_cov_6.676486_3_plen_44_part_00